MLSSTMALFNRSFRIDARSTRPHVLRFLFVGFILLELIGTHEMDLVFGAPGLTVFKSIAWLNFAIITFAGIGYFATAISEEKEEDSLGLLKMAGIGPTALLLGKSTTRLITVLLLLAVEFPFVLLSITLGGVTMTQVIAMSVALAAYLVLVANLGLIFSVLGTNARQASTLMTLTLALLLIVLPLMAQLVQILPNTGAGTVAKTLAGWEDKTSMWSRISAITSTGFGESPLSAQVICHLLAALGCFGLSWAGFETFTRERHQVGTTERIFARNPGRATRDRINRAWTNALMWKDFYFVNGGMRMMKIQFVLFLFVIGGLWTLMIWSNPYGIGASMLGGTAMMTMLVAAAIELGLVASRIFRDEVQAHTLPLVMMLPKTTQQIAWSKAASALPTLIPAAFYFLLGALMDSDDFGQALSHVVFTWWGLNTFLWFALFLHLAAYLSLAIKWGALPMAIFLVFLFQSMFTTLFGALAFMMFRWQMRSDVPLLVCEISIGAAAIVLLERRIAARLKKLAGQ
jgi:ABC-type transport system involved in multi-copper enzyme maturation permease subunit